MPYCSKAWQAHRVVDDVPDMPVLDVPDDLTLVPGCNPIRVKIDRRTHYMRYEDETEDSVTIVVEKKE